MYLQIRLKPILSTSLSLNDGCLYLSWNSLLVLFLSTIFSIFTQWHPLGYIHLPLHQYMLLFIHSLFSCFLDIIVCCMSNLFFRILDIFNCHNLLFHKEWYSYDYHQYLILIVRLIHVFG
jgi:hypothetical protein